MSFSEKMMALGKKRSVIREIFEYSKSRKAEIGAENVFDFSIGNPSVAAPQEITDAMVRLLKEQDPVVLHGYTAAQGDPAVRRKLADAINEEFQADVRADLIYMTCGAAASLTISLAAIAQEGDEVIVFAPYFPEYRVFIEKAGAKMKSVLCKIPDFNLDFDALEEAITEKTKAVIINSPNNPTGVIISEEELIRLSAVLRKKSEEYKHPIYLISDEPYRKLVWNGATVPFVTKYYENSIVCYSFSKAVSLPGERIGYILISPKMEQAEDVYAAVCGAGRALGFVCAPSLLQFTVAECVNVTSDFSVYRENRRLLAEELTRIGYEAAQPDGAFYLFMKALEPDAYAFCQRAKNYELLLVPSDDFGCGGYVRIAYCVTTEQIKRAIPAFEKLYEDYQK